MKTNVMIFAVAVSLFAGCNRCDCEKMPAVEKILVAVKQASGFEGCMPAPPTTPFSGTATLPGGATIEMVWIEPGSYLRGRYPGEQDSDMVEDPQHEVTLTRGFWMGKYTITKGQWQALMEYSPWEDQRNVLDHPDSPAVYVNDLDIDRFLEVLNDFTGYSFRLPTEAEWEYAARAGTVTRFYWGDDPDYLLIDNYAWYRENASALGNDYAHVVGQKLPNPWGLYDMSGNVWEWCYDTGEGGYTVDEYPMIDPVFTEPRWVRIIRGGAMYNAPNHCRSAYRSYTNAVTQDYCYGFRIVCF